MGHISLAVDLSPIFLSTGITVDIFQQSGKLDSFRHIFKISASRTLLQQLIACLSFFRYKKSIMLVQMKEMISMHYDSSTSSLKPWR